MQKNALPINYSTTTTFPVRSGIGGNGEPSTPCPIRNETLQKDMRIHIIAAKGSGRLRPMNVLSSLEHMFLVLSLSESRSPQNIH